MKRNHRARNLAGGTLLGVLLALPGVASAQGFAAAPSSATSGSRSVRRVVLNGFGLGQQAQGATQHTSTVRVLTPKEGEKIAQNFVSVTLEVANNASPSGTPTIEYRLDARDPIRTTSTEQTFTGLTVGAHALKVELLDANNTPVVGTRAELQFTVVQPKPGAAGLAGDKPQQAMMVMSTLETLSTRADVDPEPDPGPAAKAEPIAPPPGTPTVVQSGMLPDIDSQLPLLAVIGFGVLIGGMVSAMKTRRAAQGATPAPRPTLVVRERRERPRLAA